MGKLHGKDPKVWMKALRWHTYEAKPQNEGDCYLAHEEMVETIEIHKFAVRDTPPPRAEHSPTTIRVQA